jgi:nucleotide-binding universal stress UspA family protein
MGIRVQTDRMSSEQTDESSRRAEAAPQPGPGEWVLVGVEDTDFAIHALEWSAGLARLRSMRLELLHSVSPWVGMELAIPPFDYTEYRAAVTDRMNEWADGLDGVEFRIEVREDYPARAILAAADELGPALIALGSHGKSSWIPHMLGAVTSKVLHAARVPVVVVPPAAQPIETGVRFVVGVDGSASSLRALRWTALLASSLSASVYAVTIFPYEPHAERPRLAEPDSPDAVSDTLEALRSLTLQVSMESGQPIESDVFIGDPAARLVEASQTETMLVIGSTGHSALASAVFGATSRQCAARSEVATVIIP